MSSALDDLICAERDAPPAADPEQAGHAWRRVRNSVAVGAVAPFDLPPGGFTSATPAGTATAAATTAAATTAAAAGAGGVGARGIAKVVAALMLFGGAGYAGRALLGGNDRTPTTVPAVTSAADAPSDTAAAPPNNPRAPALAPTGPANPALAPTARSATPTVPANPAISPATLSTTPRVPSDLEPGPSSADTRRRTPAEGPARASGLGEELELIKRATRALNAGRYRQALATLAQHKRRYARGEMVEDRQALRAIALCKAGRTRAGRTAAKDFQAKNPGSLHAARVAEACRERTPGQ